MAGTQDQTFITNKVLTATAEVPGTSAFLAAAGANYNVGTVGAKYHFTDLEQLYVMIRQTP
jgi:hypothetical protein